MTRRTRPGAVLGEGSRPCARGWDGDGEGDFFVAVAMYGHLARWGEHDGGQEDPSGGERTAQRRLALGFFDSLRIVAKLQASGQMHSPAQATNTATRVLR